VDSRTEAWTMIKESATEMFHIQQPGPALAQGMLKAMAGICHSFASTYQLEKPLANTVSSQAFENTSTNIAAAQMRNELTKLAESVKDPKQKQVCGVKNSDMWFRCLTKR